MKFRDLTIALLLATGAISPAYCATVTHDLSVTVISGSYTGQTAMGSLSYDDGYLVTGNETLGPLENGGASLSFGSGDLLLTEVYDKHYPLFPWFVFQSGQLTRINFLVEDGFHGADLRPFNVKKFEFADDLMFDPQNGYSVGVVVTGFTPSPVPLPLGLPMLLAALVGLGAMFRRKSAQASVRSGWVRG